MSDRLRTVVVVAVGLVLLGAFVVFAGYGGGASNKAMSRGALYFIPVWLVGAGVNMALGLYQDQRPMADEAPTFAIVFAIPALVALFMWWRLSTG